MNMDETAVQHLSNPRAGNIVGAPMKDLQASKRFTQAVDRKMTRAHTTLVAFICNDDALQSNLPQVFLPASKTLTATDREAFRNLGAPIETWEGSNGWMNVETMTSILTRLRQRVREKRPNARLLLLMDAASPHISNDVLVHAAKLQIYVLLVPSQMTWLMQPLDVFAFSPFKQRLYDLQEKCRSEHGTTTLPRQAWIKNVGQATHEIIVKGSWSLAFSACGLQVGRDGVSSRLAGYMPKLADVPSRPLTDEECWLLMGRRRENVRERFFNGPMNVVLRREHAALGLGRGRGRGRGSADVGASNSAQ